MNEVRITKHLMIFGRVQGVYFRESLRQQAEMRRVSGWVRNRREGAVEAMLQGDQAAVSAVIAWCRHGPEMAAVERVDIGDGQGEFDGFERLGTL